MEFEYAIKLALGITALEDIPIMFRDKASDLQNTEELLEYVRSKQWEEIKVNRDNAETSGLPFKDKILDYDMRSAFKLDIAMETAKQVGEGFSIDWTMQDNTVVDCKCKLNKIYQATISVEYTLSRKVSNSSSGL